MIKIQHTHERLDSYSTFVADRIQKVNEYLKAMSIPTDPVITIKKGGDLEKILKIIGSWTLNDFYGDDSALQNIKSKMLQYSCLKEVESHPRKRYKSDVHKALIFIFIEEGYNEGDFNSIKNELYADVDINTCPYCNRQFTTMVETKDKTYVRGQLDHFYPKDKYPYLALHYYNLVPSCYNCNHGKSDDVKLNLINPYSLTTFDSVTFSVKINNSHVLKMKEFADGVEIEVNSTDKTIANMKDNIYAFHLKDLYNTHKDYVAELYFKRKLRINRVYIEKMMSFLKTNNIRLTASDQKRLITGVYTDEKDYGKRPLSKFCTDIAKQFGLI